MDKVFREIYFDIYSAGMEARRLKNIYNIDGTAIFIDSKFAKYRNKTHNNGSENLKKFRWSKIS